MRSSLLVVGAVIMGCLVSAVRVATAQPIVINEFRNATPDAVELLVVANDLNIQGYIIKDFSSSGNGDGGRALTFSTNNSLWASLPAGTLIVLRNDTSAADVTVGSGDYNLDVGLLNTNYFILGSGTFDIATDDIIMIKTNGVGTAGITGSVHAVATDTAFGGTNYAAIVEPKLGSPTGDTPAGNSLEATTPNASLADYSGTNAIGDNATGSIGTWNNANNQTYILSLRSFIPTNTPPVVTAPSPHIVLENGSLSFPVVAQDPTDNDVITLLASNLPPGAVFNAVTNATLASNSFSWASATPAGVYTTSFYAVDKDGVSSTSVVITVQAALANGPVWINEMEYLASALEYIEVAGPAGTDLSEYRLLLYNGNGGALYDTFTLTGTIDDEGCGYGAVSVAAAGMQNGSPDGVALIQVSAGVTSVIQFLSYEGSFIAAGGAANGLLSLNIGEQVDAANSLQLTGSGTSYADFAWVTNTLSSGSLNSGQTISSCAPATNVSFSSASSSIGEQSIGQIVYVVKSLAEGDVSAQIVISGTATEGAGNDFTVSTTNITLNGTTTSNLISISVNDDAIDEADETVVLTLVNVTGGTLVSPSSFTLTIVDNDVTPLANGPVWINEFNYDDPGTDSNEFIEVAGPAGTDLSIYTILYVNGGDGASYGSLTLSGVIDDEGCGYGAVSFATPGLQNGAPDGFALVSNGVETIQFISYEGVFNGTNGLQSINVGTDLGSGEDSLQLSGSGSTYADFAWSTSTFSAGSLNAGQTITPCGGGDTVLDEYDVTGVTVAPGNVSITVTVTSNGVPYSLLFTTNLNTAPVPTGTADTEVATGGPVTLQDTSTTEPQKYYWIRTND